MINAKNILKRYDPEEKAALLDELLTEATPQDLEDVEQAIGLSPIIDFIDEAQSRLDTWGKVQGIRSGYSLIDYMTLGFVPGELTILSGQTSHGKTQLAVNMAYRIAKEGHLVVFVTLEMTKAELTSRFMKIAEPNSVADLPILFQNAPAMNYKDVPELIRKAKENNAAIIFIDHLHYFGRGTDNVSQELGAISKAFKEAAIEHDIPVVLLAHVRRTNKPEEMPDLEDIRDSALIAQDADVVLMVWRNLTITNPRPDNEVDIAIFKNRNRGMSRGKRYTTLFADGITLSEYPIKK